MVQTEYYTTRPDGVKLYRSYSDSGMKLNKDGTEKNYDEAIDIENSGSAYTETELPIDSDTEEPTVQDALDMLSELGVDTDDQ